MSSEPEGVLDRVRNGARGVSTRARSSAAPSSRMAMALSRVGERCGYVLGEGGAHLGVSRFDHERYEIVREPWPMEPAS